PSALFPYTTLFRSGDVLGEVFAQRALQTPQGLRAARLAGGAQADLPSRQLRDQLDPLAPGEGRAPAPLELAKPGDEIAGQALLADAVPFEQARDHGEDLARLDRLHEVVVYLDPDRLAQRALILALRHHHDRHGGVEGPDLADQLEAASPRHLFVQQHDAVGLAPQQRERVVAVSRGGHREPLVLEEAPVRRESLDFVIHPEDGLRAHHRPKLMATGEAGQRRTYFATCCVCSWSASAPSATSC